MNENLEVFPIIRRKSAHFFIIRWRSTIFYLINDFRPPCKSQKNIFLPRVKLVSAANIPVGKMKIKAIATATKSKNNIREKQIK
jgi:hypothetical protein